MAWTGFADDLVFVFEDAEVAVYEQNLFVSTAAVVSPVVSGESVPSLHVIETSGAGADLIHNTITPGYLNPSAQVTAKHEEYQQAFDLAMAAWNACWQIKNQFVGSGEVLPWYLWLRPTQQPFDMGVDADGKARVGFNVVARMRP